MPKPAQKAGTKATKETNSQISFLKRMLEESESYTLLGSYYNFRDNLTSILMLNSALPLQVTPTF